MAPALTDREGKIRSVEIDREIAKENVLMKKRIDVLMMGTTGSGKSTIMKKIRLRSQGSFPQAELSEYRDIVYANLLESAQSIARFMRKRGMEFVHSGKEPHLQTILDYKSSDAPVIARSEGPEIENAWCAFDPEVSKAIHELSKDPIIQEVMHAHYEGDLALLDNAEYFLNEALRIGESDYLPSDRDVLNAWKKTEEIVESTLMMGVLHIRLIDVAAQRNERRKWIHCFDRVTCVIFCAALSDYSRVLTDEGVQKRELLSESLELFESLVNSRWFLRTSFVLFLTKIDILGKKLATDPLERYFPEYTGGADTNQAAQFILSKFMQMNRARLTIYPLFTQATDSSNIASGLLFTAVKETIKQNSLKDCRIL